MFYYLILTVISSLLVNLSAAADCNWMFCYSTELKDCDRATREDCRSAAGVWVEYREAPLFSLKSKCCKKWRLQSIQHKYLYCVKTIQNTTHHCKSFSDQKIEISTKNNCNKFGCTLISYSDNKKNFQEAEFSMSATSTQSNRYHTSTSSSVGIIGESTTSNHRSNDDRTGGSETGDQSSANEDSNDSSKDRSEDSSEHSSKESSNSRSSEDTKAQRKIFRSLDFSTLSTTRSHHYDKK